MANAAGFIQESIWRDEHWRQLSRTAQATYMQLLSQKELDCAGVLPLHPSKWAKGCEHVTEADIRADLDELQRERFIFFDANTDEAFIRSYIRNSNVLKVPNMFKSALRSAALVGSEVIRVELAAELRLTDREEALALAQKLNPSLTLPEPFANPSEINPSGTLPEPTGVGVGVGVGVTSVSNHLGERRPKCSKHQENAETGCRACMRRREWDEAHEQAARADEVTQRRLAKERADNCPVCHGTNVIDVGDNEARKCNHQQGDSECR